MRSKFRKGDKMALMFWLWFSTSLLSIVSCLVWSLAYVLNICWSLSTAKEYEHHGERIHLLADSLREHLQIGCTWRRIQENGRWKSTFFSHFLTVF